MNAKQVIQQGERAKYIVTSNRQDFDFGVNDYHLEIIYGMMGAKITIEKTDFQKLDDYWVFSFPTDNIVGKVMARLVMEIGDRQEVDEQYKIRQKVNSLTLKRTNLKTDLKIAKSIGNEGQVDKIKARISKINKAKRDEVGKLPTESLKKQVKAINR